MNDKKGKSKEKVPGLKGIKPEPVIKAELSEFPVKLEPSESQDKLESTIKLEPQSNLSQRN